MACSMSVVGLAPAAARDVENWTVMIIHLIVVFQLIVVRQQAYYHIAAL